MAKAKKKALGRPMGSANVKSNFLRDRVCTQFRCSEGFNKVTEEIQKKNPAYKSKADVLHRALEILAARELDATNYWYNKIQ